MKRLAGRQTHYYNQLEGRRGTLWESRYKSSPVQADDYLLACIRYIELNPIRARMIAAAEHYPWSSIRRWDSPTPYPWLDPVPIEWPASPAESQDAGYARFLREAIPEGEWEGIRDAVQRGQLTGNGRFVAEVERILGRRIEHRRPGRPDKGQGTGRTIAPGEGRR